MSQNGETHVSLGEIVGRAEKLEAAQEKPAETAPIEDKTAETTQETTSEGEKTVEISHKSDKSSEDKKVPNDPEEMRKWNTRVSMENKQIKDQLGAVQKQLEDLAAAFNKTAKKPTDWKELAKDPAKLQAAVEEQQKQLVAEMDEKSTKERQEFYRDIANSEKERRLHDPAYPRWGELLPKIMKLAAGVDSRVDFNKHPKQVLDQLYEVAQTDVPVVGQTAPVATPKAYTEDELQARVAEAAAKAREEAQKGLKAEEKGSGVASMGKGAQKGKGGDVKDVAWKMPLGDLKAAIQQATDNR